MHVLTIIGKILAWIVGVVLLLLLVVILAIQIPAVQNWALAQATPLIEDLLGGANVEIDHLDIDFFDEVSVEGILVEDQRGDTLVYAREIGADIGAFSLFGAEIFLDEVRLDGAVVNAYQLGSDTAFNYQFIADAFAAGDTLAPAPADRSAAAFDFGLRTLRITNTRIRLLDEVAGTDFDFVADELLAVVDDLSLDPLALDVANVRIAGVRGGFAVDAHEPVAQTLAETATDTLAGEAVAVAFPYAGLPITLGELDVEDVDFRYADANVAPVAEGLDAGNIVVTDLTARASGFAWDSTRIALDWEELSFRERSGLAVRELGFGLEVSPAELALTEFAVATDASRVLAEARLGYGGFASLTALDPDTEVDLALGESFVALSDIRLLAPTLEEIGLDLDARGNVHARGRVTGTLRQLRLEGLEVRAGQQTAMVLSGAIANPLDPEALAYDVSLDRLTSSYADLRRLTTGLELPPALAEFGRFRLSGELSGGTTAFRGRGLDLRTDGRTSFRGDLALDNLDDPDNLYVDADVTALRTDAAEVEAFLPDGLGVDVGALGAIDFAGQFEGTLTDFVVDGRLDTDAGSARADLVADFNADYTDGTYRGTVALDSFDLGGVLMDSTLGTLTLTADVDGSGLSPEDLASTLDGTVASFTYNGYTYRDIRVDGAFDQQMFSGQLGIDDPNLRFAFDGTVDLRDSLPDLRFVARLDTAALQPLGFYPTPLGASMLITANLRGNNADNLTGKLLVDDLALQDSTDEAFLDSLQLLAGDTTQGRFLLVTSPLVDAGIVGAYSTADLPALLTNYVNDFFPVDAYLSPRDTPAELAIEPEPQPERVLPDQRFEFYVGLSDPVAFAELFDAGLERLDTLSLVGNFDSRAKELNALLYVPGLAVAGAEVDTVLATIGGDATEMLVALRAAGVAAAGQEIEVATTELRLRDETAEVGLVAFASEPDSVLASTTLAVTMNDAGRYLASFTQPLVVTNQVWDVDAGNRIEYWDTYLDVDALVFRHEGQSIAIQSDDASPDDDVAPLTVTIDDYRLSEVARLVALEGFSLDGLVDGTVAIREPMGELYYLADLTVADIVLNGQPVGTLIANATSEGLDDQVVVDVRLDGPVNDLAVAGTYGISDGALDIAADIRAFELRVIDPLAVGVLADSEGLLRADLDVSGTVGAPAVDGYLALDGAATTFELLGTRLRVDDSRIDLSEDLLDFNTFVVADSAGQTMSLSGTIAHDYFTDFAFDLALRTDGFQVLNTEPSLEELYYGVAFIRAELAITGDLDLPVVRGEVGTLAGTDVVIVPLITTAGVSEESWVVYADDPGSLGDTATQLSDVYQANTLGVDLAVEIAVDPASTLEVIVNPATGDQLVARGEADLQVTMSPNGDLGVTGVYEIVEGSYQFTFEGGGFKLVQRNFEIREGSSLRFVGDPLDSRFDITAAYGTEIPTVGLLQAVGYVGDDVAGNNQPDVQRAKQRQPVYVLLEMSGSLDDPDIQLDFDIPQAGGGATNKVQDALAYLRSNRDQLYKQAFGVLVLGNFIGSSGGGGLDPAAAGKNLAINSVSGLVSNQLNKLADNVVGDAFEIDVGVESYENQYLGRQNTANVDLSRSLFDDRLTITVGTDVNVGSDSPTTRGGASPVSTNYVITYRLTENGRYLVRAFRRPDYDILATGANNETGVGLTYQRTFD